MISLCNTYEYLQQQDVIFNKRGIGFFVDETAPEKIREIRRKRFFEQDLPEFTNNFIYICSII
jgi:DNA-binding transcriptional regulator YhcF (GntR family)